ncbi:hypothetical protein RE628_11320 [Paenibacillus sp. D2_2]|uniref:hypothetical protein n=1 Tax=Paenibacillus sp. D2_2 TaxID=3073092 RepID=UPI002816674A|nr:hypothetical protein [Paenibacillus sp. D2_2]WMT42817.1 hypothetical protein RE628_11320 [Paenibacillus sp. D2_2]
MKQVSILKSDSVTANNDGVLIKSGSTEIFLGWDIVGKIADVSEPHFQKEMMMAFGSLVLEANTHE